MRLNFKILLFALLACNLSIAYARTGQQTQKSITVKKALSANKVIISAHRGDWRNAPENSIQSLLNCIHKGIDIAEIDLKMTKDNEIVLMHDRTIDRTTTGKGKPEDYTLSELKNLYLTAATKHPTRHRIPTLKEYLQAAKGKIIVNIDKGFDYFNEAYPIIKELGVSNQIIYNVGANMPYDSVMAKVGYIDPELYLMVVVDPSDALSQHIINSYKPHPRTIIQTVFDSDTVRILTKIPEIKKNFPVWFNALWPEHSAGHDDDIAVEENKPDETWGWLINKGATIIQTDRPTELLMYLKKRKLHK